jgi:hypothetical protein
MGGAVSEIQSVTRPAIGTVTPEGYPTGVLPLYGQQYDLLNLGQWMSPMTSPYDLHTLGVYSDPGLRGYMPPYASTGGVPPGGTTTTTQSPWQDALPAMSEAQTWLQTPEGREYLEMARPFLRGEQQVPGELQAWLDTPEGQQWYQMAKTENVLQQREAMFDWYDRNAVDDWSAPNAPVGEEPPPGWDWVRYVNDRPDLRAAGIDTEAEARRHYARFGAGAMPPQQMHGNAPPGDVTHVPPILGPVQPPTIPPIQSPQVPVQPPPTRFRSSLRPRSP